MQEYQQYIAIFVGSASLGYFLFFGMLRYLPRRLRKENLMQREEVLKEARKHGRKTFDSILSNASENLKMLEEEALEDLTQRENDLKLHEEEVRNRDEILSSEEVRLKKLEEDIKSKMEKSQNTLIQFDEKRAEFRQAHKTLSEKLAERAGVDLQQKSSEMKNKFIESRQLECQKVLKSLHEELDSTARKSAQRVLDRTMSRYAPEFAWPKSSNFIEVQDGRLAESILEEDCSLLIQLRELSGAEIQGIVPSKDGFPVVIKVAGGFGIFREAARMTLSEIVALGNSKEHWKKAPSLYKKHQEQLEQEAERLGKLAVNILKLPNIHPEVQKLVGALNWRTSYRQNQWYHTVEVAVLAGVLASELGVNPDEAKRVGMLHDIGKAIDYRIDGSHAVISGDYADRFGENRMICDTVMSHHSDLIVESPLAYVLRAADTLSGARPGARVNLEEGYQIRLTSIAEAVRSFDGIADLAIMNGGREIHIQVNNRRVKENELKALTEAITRKIEQEVTFPGQIKVLVSRSFESVTVA
jgi:ribonuclease Y